MGRGGVFDVFFLRISASKHLVLSAKWLVQRSLAFKRKLLYCVYHKAKADKTSVAKPIVCLNPICSGNLFDQTKHQFYWPIIAFT